MILITGASGQLGNIIIKKLEKKEKIYALINNKKIEYDHVINVENGLTKNNEKIIKHLDNINVIIHLASNTQNAKEVDINGTQNLVDILKRNNKNIHILMISITGIDKKNNYEYCNILLEKENIIKNSGIKYTILRTTQWHSFIKTIIENNINDNIIKLPENTKLRTIDENEVADKLIEIAHNNEPLGLLPDMIGPETLSIEKILKIYIKKYNEYNYEFIEINNPLFDLLSKDIILGNENNAIIGKITWKEYINKK